MRSANAARGRPRSTRRVFAIACAALAFTGAGLGADRTGQPSLARAEDAGAGAAPVATRDWTRAPAIIELATEADVFAVGDVHGDAERFLKLLAGAGVVKASERDEASWSAGKAVLVITGDMIDKWPHGLEVIRLVRALEARAAAQGGRVIALAGNHEVELLANPRGAKGSAFRGELEAAGIPLGDVVSGKHELGAWLRSLPLGARVNDWFFSHAGKTDGRTVAELEAALRAAIDKDGFAASEIRREDSLVEARLKPHPWWELPGEKPEAVLDRSLKALGVRHVAFGHQPGHVRFSDGSARAKGELAAHLGRVFLLDAGMSRGVGDSEGALLRIHRSGGTTEAFAVKPDGSSRSLWRGD
ncbi:metallophosphoesterase [bacterium]|nr:metallophosphoesterase [bacterium]